MRIVFEHNIFYMSVISAVLICLLLAARFAGGRRLRRMFFSIAWVLVLGRLLLPVSMIMSFEYPNVLYNVFEWLLRVPATPYVLIWAAGALVVGSVFVGRYVMCGRMLREALPIQKVPDIDEEMFTFMGIHVYVSDRIHSPVTYGIWHQRVLLPKYYVELSREQLKYILIHEKIHIDYHDNLKKFLVILAVCLHWFNPFVWLMYLCYNQDLELACDEKVIVQVGEDRREQYARVLISLAGERLSAHPVYSGFSANSIKERIVMIMRGRKSGVLSYVFCVLAALVSVAVFAVPARMEKKDAGPKAVDVQRVIHEDSMGAYAEVVVRTTERVELRMKIFIQKGFAITSGSFISFQTSGKTWRAGIDDKYAGGVTIPEAVRYRQKVYPVTGIGNCSFYQCRNLKYVVIPDTVKEIKQRAFQSCESIRTLRMPKSLELVEENPFVGCKALEQFTKPRDGEMKGQYRVEDGILYTDYGRFLKVFPQGRKIERYQVKEGVKQIAIGGFYGAQIKQVDLPKSMLRVKSRAFQNCRQLQGIRAYRGTVFSKDARLGAPRAEIRYYD